ARLAPVPIHLKVDTGMHRVGAQPEDVVGLARSVGELAELRLEGVCTPLPVADEPGNPYTPDQLARFDEVLGKLRAAGIEPSMVHAANSAGLIAHPAPPYDIVALGH